MDSSGLARRVSFLAMAVMAAASLAGCSSWQGFGFGSQPSPPAVQEPPPEPEIPSSIRPDEIVGRWGLASFHNPADRVRTETAARGQCKQPYVINPGPTGGVIMHLADEATPQELRLKGSRSGKNFIGPHGPVGGNSDREIVSFDGRVLVTRFVDKDADTRYGTMVYVRCGPKA
ncbi:MAG: hypothetical protein ACLP8B_13260 [Xanthobacteraceae bacterium]